MATIAAQQHTRTSETSRTALETTVLALLGAMVAIWIPFQIVEIGAIFPPIGVLYALGSIIIAGVVLMVHKSWIPAVASAWAALMMVPESIPAVGHLTDWSELYSHFGHYLVIMTFFPVAALLAVTGIAATIQNRSGVATAPSWLRTAITGVAAFVVIANAVTIALRVFEVV